MVPQKSDICHPMNMNLKRLEKPELLAPAGNLEKLKVAIGHGADAVYLGGEKFGLRSAAQNFSPQDLEEGVRFAHEHGAKVYLVVNGFLFDHELAELPSYARIWSEMGVDAFIVSDPGSIEVIKETVSTPIHLSTQASCLNEASARFWKSIGVKRLILGRECSWQQAKAIKENVGIEVEVFIHGALCMAYSGHCVISNYTQGRDSNRGGCAQSCRFPYELTFENDQKCQSTFLSSKDLNTLALIPALVESGIDSLKIEGRMKTALYAGVTTRTYREAIDYAYTHSSEAPSATNAEKSSLWARELASYPHREYTATGLGGELFSESVFAQENALEAQTQYVGQVLELTKSGPVVDLRSNLQVGDWVELIPPSGPILKHQVLQLKGVRGEEINKGHPNQLVVLTLVDQISYAPLQTLIRRAVMGGPK